MRLIDADKILDALNIFGDKENGNKHFMYGIETAKELIEDTLEEQEANACGTCEMLKDGATLTIVARNSDEEFGDCYMSFDLSLSTIYCPECGRRLEHEERLDELTRWIPVSERLPENAYGCLLVVEEDDWWGNTCSALLPYFAGYDGEQWNDADGEQVPFEVSHWLPLPELPKEGEA